jgi:hypothetical protein
MRQDHNALDRRDRPELGQFLLNQRYEDLAASTSLRAAAQAGVRFAFYDYLAAVFELYVRLRRTKQAKKSARLIAELCGLHTGKRAHPIRVIIDATSAG